jgi:hypothetical protein
VARDRRSGPCHWFCCCFSGRARTRNKPGLAAFGSVRRWLATTFAQRRIARSAAPGFGWFIGSRRRVASNDRRAHRSVEIEPCVFENLTRKLILQNARAHLLRGARLQLTQLERSIGNADQPVHLQAERPEHDLHLTVFAFAQAHRQPLIVALLTLNGDLHRAVLDALNLHAFARFFQHMIRRFAKGAHAVTAQPASGGQLQQAFQRAIIGQQQQPFGVEIKPAHRMGGLQLLGQNIAQNFAPFRVARRGDDALVLVIKPKPGALSLRQGRTINLDPVLFGDRHSRCGEQLAVQLHPAIGDPGFRIAARAETGARDDFRHPIALAGRIGFACFCHGRPFA